MANTVQLAFTVPTFANTQSSAAAELAMIGHPNARNQLLNQATQLQCTRMFIDGFSSPTVGTINVGVYSYKFIERYFVCFKYVEKYCLDIIRQMLEEGFHIYYSNVDDYYLPNKSWYGIRHMNHDGIICGYDDNDGTLSIAGYNIDWIFDLIRVPQECFMQGLRHSLGEGKYGSLMAYKIKENTEAYINEEEILNNLKEYINSDFDKYPTDKQGVVQGVVVHNYLAMYIDKLKDGSIPFEKMDWRALRPIWEHKKCMLERILAVEEKNNLGNSLSKRYAPVVEKADRMRMMYAIYHKNHNDKLLDKIRNGILDIAESDRLLVTEFIEKLEECIK